jgi:glycosyltransferase 2 family protein
LIWIDLANSFGLKADFISAAKAWSLSQLGKYIPGKAGLILARLNAYDKHPKRKVAIAILIEFLTVPLAACLLIFFSIFFMKNIIPNYIRIIAIALSVCLFIFFIRNYSNLL